ncbi:MAG TPA: hypothetical protein VHV10_21205 [Ktedonobacteraceae bacterium]|nr:hypothetical protein [Ktedonobacteraceae bacterium]
MDNCDLSAWEHTQVEVWRLAAIASISVMWNCWSQREPGAAIVTAGRQSYD